jgi:phosphoribosylaminoimidazole-succinocarboxamide synthase
MKNQFTPKFAPAVSGLELLHQGKTRDTFATTSEDTLLIVATNRLSTHNIIHQSEVPHKGEILTALTIFWLKELLQKCGIPHHLVACGTEIYKHLPGTKSDYPADLHYRAIVVRKLSMIPVEFIFRNYMTGSLFDKFYSKGLPNPYGLHLEPGLVQMSQFSKPVFTPTDKSETDDPLDSLETTWKYHDAFMVASGVFFHIDKHLQRVGIELIDSKFELGIDNSGEASVVIADEIATPDSSRFCNFVDIQVGYPPPWLDKQIARDKAEEIWGDGKKSPITFETDVIFKLSATYLGIFHRITGRKLEDFQKKFLS